jgi:hypothetical protein
MENKSLDELKKQAKGKNNYNNKGRQQYTYNGQVVYEWEQNLEEVLIYIKAPDCLLEKNREIIKQNLKPGETLPKLDVVFTPTHLKLGLKNFPPYLDVINRFTSRKT